MSLDSLIFWLFAAAWVVVIALILVGGLLPAWRQGMRIVKRLMALIAESPVPLAIERAGHDADRINAALDRIPELQTRALVAVEMIRTTPIVPPALGDFAARVKREIRAFRRELRR